MFAKRIPHFMRHVLCQLIIAKFLWKLFYKTPCLWLYMYGWMGCLCVRNFLTYWFLYLLYIFLPFNPNFIFFFISRNLKNMVRPEKSSGIAGNRGKKRRDKSRNRRRQRNREYLYHFLDWLFNNLLTWHCIIIEMASD